MSRTTYKRYDVMAGCWECHGGNAHWYGKNAHGVAARHHDATGHRTWVEANLGISYGKRPDEGLVYTPESGTPDALANDDARPEA